MGRRSRVEVCGFPPDRAVLDDLIQRGLRRPKLLIVDGVPGPLLGEATHRSFTVCNWQHPSRRGIREDAEEKHEGGAILNSGSVKNFCLARGPPKKMDFF